MRIAALLGGMAAAVWMAAAAQAAPVLMISIDGLRPADVTEAQARGFDVPNLTRLEVEGLYATGVRNSLPTVTYPNHTTMITGVWPAKHGVANNTVFDPRQQNLGGWYWYSEDIKVPTLWDAVHQAGKPVANISWPVGVGSRVIDFNLPEYWRARIPEDLKLIRAIATPGLVPTLEKESGVALAQVEGEDPASDDARAAFAAALYRLKKPQFFTLHLVSLDETQHMFGPGSPEAKATLHQIDAAVGRLVAAARQVEPDLVVAVVSDHGFSPTTTTVNLMGAFADAGLLTIDPKTHKVATWDAEPWGGASAAIVLAHPEDAALKAKVADLLAKLAARPELGVARVADAAEIARMGGTPAASFWVDFKDGFEAGGDPLGPPTSSSRNRGGHGYFPDHPSMRATFIVAGPGAPKKGAIGEIDQRDIAPTIAKLLEVPFPSADGKPLF